MIHGVPFILVLGRDGKVHPAQMGQFPRGISQFRTATSAARRAERVNADLERARVRADFGPGERP